MVDIQRKERAKDQMVASENPVNRLNVRESDIPLDALYNEHVNSMKMNEKSFHLKCKPITFNVWKNYKGQPGQNLTRMIKNEGREEIM